MENPACESISKKVEVTRGYNTGAWLAMHYNSSGYYDYMPLRLAMHNFYNAKETGAVNGYVDYE